MCKIVLLTGTLHAGGAERVISILANQLIKENYKIEIITWKDAPVFYEFDSRICIQSLPRLSKSDVLFKQMYVLRNYIKQSRPDICISFLAPFNIVTLFSLLGLKQKIIVAERNDPRFVPFSKLLRVVRNIIYHTAFGVLTQTDNNKNYFSKKLQRKTTVIYNPIFLSEDLLRKALNVPKKDKIVCVSRLVKQKNLLLLLDVFSRFVKDNPTYRLIIYGEGNQRLELEHKIEELQLQGKVELPGAVKDVHSHLLDASMFVLPSNFEGMPNALLEAMCLGLPCISTKVSGAVDLIEDGKNGLLVNIDSSQQLEEAMRKLSQDRALANMLAYNACFLYDKLNVGVIYKEWKNFIQTHLS